MEKDEEFFHGRMMPQFFSAHGYATWGVGKIGHGYSDKKLFDVYAGSFRGPVPSRPMASVSIIIPLKFRGPGRKRIGGLPRS